MRNRRSPLINEIKFRNFVRKTIREAMEATPGDAPPDQQAHIFDFDDTLGLTLNANGVMLYNDGEPAHRSEKEVMDWLRTLGIGEKDLLDPKIESIAERDGGYAAFVNSSALAKIQTKYPREQQTVTGFTEPAKVKGAGEMVAIDFTPSGYTDVKTTTAIQNTIDKLKSANAAGSDTIVITARKAEGEGTNFRGQTTVATNKKDMEEFLSSQGAAPTMGVMGVTGQNKGKAIVNKFMKRKDPPDEIHFYDDLKKNTDEVEGEIAGKEPVELFIYGPGEFAHGEADPNRPNKSIPPAAKKIQKESVDLDRWALLAGIRRR